jgi:hypothetical protein
MYRFGSVVSFVLCFMAQTDSGFHSPHCVLSKSAGPIA